MPTPFSQSKKAKGWLTYLILVAATLAAHTCAVESDAQAVAAASARHV